MKKTYNYLIPILSFLPLSCSNNETHPIQEEPIAEEINLPPNSFTIKINNITSDKALINWDESTDPENDPVTYSIFLEGNETAKDITTLEYEFTKLSELTKYNGNIIAKDNQDNETSVNFEFTTEKYYLKFIKEFNYADSENGGIQRGSPSSMIKTQDGNYIIAGQSNFNSSGAQFFVLKVDYEGNELWKKFYGYQLWDNFEVKIVQSTDGYIMSAHHHVLKIDNNGGELWHKKIDSYDIPDGGAEIRSLKIDSQDNIYLVGGRGSGNNTISQIAVLTKLNKLGEILWEKEFSSSYRNFFFDLYINLSDELIILGSIETSGITYENYSNTEQIDFWVVKTNNNGDIIWQNTYGDNKYDHPKKIIPTNNNEYILTGFSNGAYEVLNGSVFRINSEGNQIWGNSYSLSRIYSIAETLDNGFIAVGHKDFGTFGAMGIYKMNSLGDVEWERSFQETFTHIWAYCVLSEEDGGYRIAAGKTKNGERSKLRVYKTDPNGNFE